MRRFFFLFFFFSIYEVEFEVSESVLNFETQSMINEAELKE